MTKKSSLCKTKQTNLFEKMMSLSESTDLGMRSNLSFIGIVYE
jgi:hypothetical protein